MKLLPKLYDPESGRIFIDNYDISKGIFRQYAFQVGIVPQDSLLFEGTISDNISLNNPEASSDSIIEAAKILVPMISSWNLVRVTQHLLLKRVLIYSWSKATNMIARTILNNPSLLVLDEATSALDFETEKNLCVSTSRGGPKIEPFSSSPIDYQH